MAVIAVATMLIVGWRSLFPGEITYLDAREDSSKRDAYIERIVQQVGGKPEYVSVVNYIDTQEERDFLKEKYSLDFDPERAMSTSVTRSPREIAANEPVDVVVSVWPFAFETDFLQVEDDFVSSLLHEFRHGEAFHQRRIRGVSFDSFYINEDKWNRPLASHISELDTLAFEFDSEFQLSTKYLFSITSRYLQHYVAIWKTSQGMDSGFIEDLKVDYFERWMLAQPAFHKELSDEREVWYFRSFNTGETFAFSENEITQIKKKLSE